MLRKQPRTAKLSNRRQQPRSTKKGKARSQQDNVWKEMLDDMFEQFMAFSFPKYHRLVDWTKQYERLDKEMIEISEEGGFSKQSADKLFRVFFKSGAEQLILMHVEVQGYTDDSFAERVWNYKRLIQQKYRQPVLSFAVLTDPDKDFRPTGYRWELEDHLELYNFPMLKLLDYWQHWNELEQDPNPFAVLVMAHLKAQRLKRRPLELKEVRLQAIRMLLERGYSREFVIRLVQFVEGLVQLPPNLEIEYKEEARKLNEEVIKMPLVSVFERIAKEDGVKEGMLVVISSQFEQRFGSLEPELHQQLENLSVPQLQELSRHLLSLTSKEDLKAWLEKRA